MVVLKTASPSRELDVPDGRRRSLRAEGLPRAYREGLLIVVGDVGAPHRGIAVGAKRVISGLSTPEVAVAEEDEQARRVLTEWMADLAVRAADFERDEPKGADQPISQHDHHGSWASGEAVGNNGVARVRAR